jgi:hypothetical protein
MGSAASIGLYVKSRKLFRRRGGLRLLETHYIRDALLRQTYEKVNVRVRNVPISTITSAASDIS